MKVFWINLSLTSIALLILGPVLPYWVMMVLVAFFGFLVGGSGAGTFFGSGFGFGIVWLLKSIWISIQTQSELPKMMAELIGLPGDNFLWFVTGLIGFLIGAFSGLTGSLFKRLFERRTDNIYKQA